MFTVYILYSENHNAIYCGYTSDLLNRFRSHNYLAIKGHTIKYRPCKVIHLEYFENKSEAMNREKQLKSSRGRAFVRNDVIPYMRNIGFIRQ